MYPNFLLELLLSCGKLLIKEAMVAFLEFTFVMSNKFLFSLCVFVGRDYHGKTTQRQFSNPDRFKSGIYFICLFYFRYCFGVVLKARIF